MHETIFCLKDRSFYLAATSNLRVEQNLVHLGRFLHFSQKVVGVTLNNSATWTAMKFIFGTIVLVQLSLNPRPLKGVE